jgi:hypothetical protein
MTLVVAAQFGSRIIVFSDTMISNKSIGNDIIPGRLKSIVINGTLSVSYSGNVDIALDSVRRICKELPKYKDIKDVIDLLIRTSTNFSCDFIVATHLPEPCLIKIADGKMSTGGNRYWIGNPEPIRRLAEIEAALPIPIGYVQNPIQSLEESTFRRAIQETLFDPAQHAAGGVGGFLIEILGSPYGHCYGSHATVKWFDTTHFPPGITARQLADRASGMTMFGYNVISAAERGVPVMGIFIDQIGIGYIYRPTEQDSPDKLYPCTLEQITDLVGRRARGMGGFLND